jgi:iron complex outermembrane recepter protein
MARGSGWARCLVRAALALASVAFEAHAESGSAATTDAASEGIDQIRVTAQKRDADLLDTSISLSVFGATQIEEFGISNALDLTEYTPNVNLQLGADGSQYSITSRGIGQADVGSITTSPATGVYLDGVYFGPTIGNLLDVADLERIEVLRGPQGDLWGRNTTAGAIQPITRAPSGELGARASLAAGTKRQLDFRGSFEFPLWGGSGVPVPDALGELSGALGLVTRTRDAFYPNHVAADIQEMDRLSGRAALMWELGDFRARYTYHGARVEEQGPEMQLTDLNATAAAAPLFDGRTQGLGFGVDMRPFESRSRCTHLDLNGVVAEDEQTIAAHSLVARFRFDDVPVFGDFELRSITGYIDTEVDSFNDRDGTPYEVFRSSARTDQWQVSEELDWVGSRAGAHGQLDYTLGYFYLHEAGETVAGQFSLQDPAFDLAPDDTDGDTVPDALDPGQRSTQIPRIDNDSHAVFGHVAYRPPVWRERLELEAGLRFTEDTKRVQSQKTTIKDNGAAPVAPNFGPTSAAKKFSELAPTARLGVRLLDAPENRLNGYFSFSTGFTAGGYNSRATSIAALETPYKPEHVSAYELGFKFEGLDRRLRLSAAGFYMSYRDLQRTILSDLGDGVIASAVLNAGDALIWGAEIEALAAPFPGALINLGYGLALPKYRHFIDTDPATGLARDFADERKFSNAPKHSANAGAQYALPSFAWGRLAGRVDLYWQSATLLQNGDNPLAGEDSYSIVNARVWIDDLALPASLGDVTLALWIRNAFDTPY